MIDYSTGTWGIGYLFILSGSVFNKSLVIAFPNACLAAIMHIITQQLNWAAWINYDKDDVDEDLHDLGMQVGFAGITTVLGMLLVFRTQQAYKRWWEGATLLLTVRGEWFNAYSNLLAFCTRDPALQKEVDTFQHLLMRLMSLLYCSALQQLSTLEHSAFEVIDLNGIDRGALSWLQESGDRCEVILAWIQRMTVDAHYSKVLPIPPPILSRVFQELSRGIVNFSNVRKIAEIPFPFPYVQTLTVLLLVHWVLTPILMSVLCKSWWWAGIVSFLPTLALWSVYYVAQEIECPFGDDPNDLPLVEMQTNFNQNLISLIMAESQQAPSFEFNEDRHWKMHVANLEDGVTFDELQRISTVNMDARGPSSHQRSSMDDSGAPPSPAPPMEKQVSPPPPPAVARALTAEQITSGNRTLSAGVGAHAVANSSGGAVLNHSNTMATARGSLHSMSGSISRVTVHPGLPPARSKRQTVSVPLGLDFSNDQTASGPRIRPSDLGGTEISRLDSIDKQTSVESNSSVAPQTTINVDSQRSQTSMISNRWSVDQQNSVDSKRPPDLSSLPWLISGSGSPPLGQSELGQAEADVSNTDRGFRGETPHHAAV